MTKIAQVNKWCDRELKIMDLSIMVIRQRWLIVVVALIGYVSLVSIPMPDCNLIREWRKWPLENTHYWCKRAGHPKVSRRYLNIVNNFWNGGRQYLRHRFHGLETWFPELVRLVRGISWSVSMRMEFVLRFGYVGHAVIWWFWNQSSRTSATSQPLSPSALRN